MHNKEKAMKFSEAMELLKSGSKVTRQPWIDNVYFLMKDSKIKSYQPVLAAYQYNEDIMISDGWTIIGGLEENLTFCQVIPLIQKGAKAKLEDWKDMFIYYDSSIKGLVLYSMEIHTFIPDFDSFVAQDWIELEKEKYNG